MTNENKKNNYKESYKMTKKVTKKDFYFEKALSEIKDGYLMPYELGICKKTSEQIQLYNNAIQKKEVKKVIELEDGYLYCNIQKFISICYQAEKKDLRVSGFISTEHMIFCKVKDYAQYYLNIRNNKKYSYIYFKEIQKWNCGYRADFSNSI